MMTITAFTAARSAAFALAASASVAAAQPCLVANPSFEVGTGLDGWFPLNDVTLESGLFAHGRRAVSIAATGETDADISAIVQARTAGAGTVLHGTVRVGHTPADPLTGGASGIAGVQWFDALNNSLGIDSFELLTPGDPTGRLLRREFSTSPAPAGTAWAGLLLGAIKTDTADTGRAVFDLVELTEPDYDNLQWNDFPGGRTIGFAGHTWRVKGPGFYGPGPNFFGDSAANVALGPDGLRLAIEGGPGAWSSSEIVIEQPLGYGDYVFTTKGRTDAIADNVVLGLFLWQYPRCYDPANLWNQHNEIDVEISRWGDPTNSNAQFVTQPYHVPENIERFDIAYTDDALVSYAFNWLPGRIEYRAWHGGPDDESPAALIHAWTYADDHLPTPEQPRVHINLWHTGTRPADEQPQSVTIADFRFRAMGDADADGELTIFDALEFLRRHDAMDPAADIDNDGAFAAQDQAIYLDDGLVVEPAIEPES